MMLRKFVAIVLLSGILAGCGNSEHKNKSTDSTTPTLVSTPLAWTGGQVAEISMLLKDALLAAYPNLGEIHSDTNNADFTADIQLYSLSPDGQKAIVVVYQSDLEPPLRLCVYTIMTAKVECKPVSDEVTSNVLPRGRFADSMLAWSPDGRYIGYQSDRSIPINNSDVWLIDVNQLSATNLTGSPTEGLSLMDVKQGATVALDYAPFWSPDSRTLYFFRMLPSESDQGKMDFSHLKLFQMKAGEWKPDEVTDLPGEMAMRFLSTKQVSMAPDGKQVALMLDNGPELWRLDLNQKKASIWLDRASLRPLVPGFVSDKDIQISILDVVWAADNQQLVVSVTLPNGPNPVDLRTFFGVIDTTTHTAWPLIDYSLYTDSQDFVDNGQAPLSVMLAADGLSLIYWMGTVVDSEADEGNSVWVLPLTGNAEAYPIGKITGPRFSLSALGNEQYRRTILSASTTGSVWLIWPGQRNFIYALTFQHE